MGNEGAYYDRDPESLIKLFDDDNYDRLVETIRNELNIESSTYSVDIAHRYITSVYERPFYVMVSITNDEEVNGLFVCAMNTPFGRRQQLFITKNRLIDMQTHSMEVTVEGAEGYSHGGFHDDDWIVRMGESSADGSDEEFGDEGNEEHEVELEVPLPFYGQVGGDGNINFEHTIRSDAFISTGDDALRVGQRFSTKQDLILAVKQHHIMNHHRFIVKNSDKRMWSVVCTDRDKGCQWQLNGCLRMGDCAFEITKLVVPHTCINPFVRNVIADKYHYDVPRRRVWEARRKAIVMEYGDWNKSFLELPQLLNAIQLSNPGTKVEWLYDESGYASGHAQFDKVFWAFAPCIDAFKHCRPVISIDGIFLTGKHKYKLLIACSMDGATHIVPLAFAIVDEESAHSWSWSLKLLKIHVIDTSEHASICIISDRHRGIRPAMSDPDVGLQHPFAQWRFCVRHVVSNFKTAVGSKKCKRLLYHAAIQARQWKCDKVIAEIGGINENVLTYLADIPLEQWTLSHDDGFRFGYLTTKARPRRRSKARPRQIS